MLPHWSVYSQNELKEFLSFSPAGHRYHLGLLRAFSNNNSSQHYRYLRNDAWLTAAIATYFQSEPTQIITQFWSQTADQIIQSGFRTLNLPDIDILALGKWGAEELNLSSDIDLIYVGTEIAEPRIWQQWHQLISEYTESGFCFRLDTDLRPGGPRAPLVTTPAQIENYYWQHGQSWERMALVRRRWIVQSPATSQLDPMLTSFVYRRYSDFNLLEELAELTSAYHLLVKNSSALNLKLAPGGIRDIELLVHALQITTGGRNPELQTHQTSIALDGLAQLGILNPAAAEVLNSTYWLYRDLEHLVQIQNDRAEHNLTTPVLTHRGLTMASINSLRQQVTEILGQHSAPLQRQEKLTSQPNKRHHDDRITELLESTVYSRNTARDLKSRRLFVEQFLLEVRQRQLEDTLATAHLVDFCKSLNRRSGLFGLLAQPTPLISKLVQIFSYSSYLVQVLMSRPEILEGLLSNQTDLNPSQSTDDLLSNAYDHRLITEFQAAGELLTKTQVAAIDSLTDCADRIVTAIWDHAGLTDSLPQLSILAMGKWGLKALGFRSDLDLVWAVPEPVALSQRRTLQKLINWLQAPQKIGRLYKLDFRLRPGGSSADWICLESHLKSQLREIPIWERQAFVTSRKLCGSMDWSVMEWLPQGLSTQDRAELRSIRSQFMLSNDPHRHIDLKLGRGGLLDIELFRQLLVLEPAISIDAELMTQLDHCYSQLRCYEQLIRLIRMSESSSIDVEDQTVPLVGRVLGKTVTQIFCDISGIMTTAGSIIEDHHPALTSFR